MNTLNTNIDTTKSKEQLDAALIEALDHSNQKLCEALFNQGKIDNQNIKKLVQLQEANIKRDIKVDIRELIINQKYIKRSELIFYLRKAWLNNRLWEQLFISWKLSLEELWKVIICQILERKKWNNISFWDTVILKTKISKDELIEFMNNNWVKLNKVELEHLELVNELKEKEKERKDRKKFIELKHKQEYSDFEKEIIEIQIGAVNQNNEQESIFWGIDLPDFHEKVKIQQEIKENKEFDINEITVDDLTKENKFRHDYVSYRD